ncbi:MAG: hypothetical protein ACHQ0J_01315 [Candidatus Dormibacterales bacterium]
MSDRSRSLSLMEQSGMASLARSGGGPGAGGMVAAIQVTVNGVTDPMLVANEAVRQIEQKMRRRGLTLQGGFG